mmetsp:Transcript_5501/g.13769  ORF Transcript_5501/g.13769 Transcript_5501/m.13769 type:complete len:121 (+) Transcript_5501:3-365(+)
MGWSNHPSIHPSRAQYVSKLDGDKLRDFVYDKCEGKVSRRKIKFRLVAEETSAAITGYRHNAVTPVATAKKIPILMSHHIARLNPNFFWLGAGEVDLKVGFSASDFIAAYGVHTVDCTVD